MVEYRVGRVGLAVALCALTGCFYLGSYQAAAAAAAPLPQVAQANNTAPASGGDSLDQRLNSLQKELDLLRAQQQQQQLLNQQRQQIENLQQKQTLQQQQIEKLERENARNSGNPLPPAPTASAAPQGNGPGFKGYFPAFTMWHPGDDKNPPGYDKDQDQASREGW